MGLFTKRARPEAAPAVVRPPRYGLLLVDDEIFNLTALAALLEDDYLVFTATSGAEALAVLERPELAGRIQVIVSDQRMPGISGVTLLGQAQQRWPGLKRILLTGYTDIESIIAAINEAAIYKYLRKPVDSHEVRLTVRRAVEVWQLEQDHDALLTQLRQALSHLRVLDADKLEFLRYLDHEMNTPLNWMGATQVLDRSQFSPDVGEVLGYVDQGHARLKSLVATVLRYFQLAGMGRVPATADVDLPLLLAQRLEAQRPDGVEVERRLPPTLLLRSEPRLLTDVLDHLLENALTHARRIAAPAVAVCLETAGAEVLLTVHNSGPGLAAAELPELFRPFRYGSDHGEQGFGISLAMAQAGAMALGGELDALSDGGDSGVTLRLRLPLRAADPTAGSGIPAVLPGE